QQLLGVVVADHTPDQFWRRRDNGQTVSPAVFHEEFDGCHGIIDRYCFGCQRYHASLSLPLARLCRRGNRVVGRARFRVSGGLFRFRPTQPFPHTGYVSKCRSRAARMSASRNSGWAISLRAWARSRKVMPHKLRAPYSVTIHCTSDRRTDTAVPGSKTGTMRDTLPPSAVLGRAMIERPPLLRAAPRTKSTSPPVPDIWRIPRLSEFTWPVKSTCTAALIATTFSRAPIR